MRKAVRHFNCVINKKYVLLFSFALVIIISIFLMISGNVLFQKPLNYRAFASMEELECIDVYAVKNIEDKDDVRLNDKKYEEKYAKQLIYNGNTFYLYAYKFTNRFDAQNYCLNVSNEINKEKLYRFSYNDTCLVAFYREYAYCVCGDNYDSFVEFYNYLVQNFSIEFD